jgi:hypothetical protein
MLADRPIHKAALFRETLERYASKCSFTRGEFTAAGAVSLGGAGIIAPDAS